MNNEGCAVKTIRWAVLSQINRMGLTDQHAYERLEQFAFECWQEELKVRAMASVEVYRNPVPNTGVINLPDDYIRYTKIGVCRNGRIQTLTLDESLCSRKPNVCGTLEESSDERYYLVPHAWNGNYYGYDLPALYMSGGGVSKEGLYKIDGVKNQIILHNTLAGAEIVMEYQSTGVVHSQTIVPILYLPALRYYMAWKYYEYNIQFVSLADREYQKFADYLTEAKIQDNMFTLDEMLDMLYETSGHKIR